MLTNGLAKKLVGFVSELQELHHVRTETAFLYVLSYREIVLLVDEVEHLLNGLFHFFFLLLRVTWTAILQHIIQILFAESIHVE